jgi:hypothetical protein
MAVILQQVAKWIFIFSLGLSAAASWAVSNPELQIGDYSLISVNKMGRDGYDFIYKAKLTNSSSNNVAAVTATLLSSPTRTLIIDGDLNFGDVSANAAVSSTDTFTLRRKSRKPLANKKLVTYLKWQISTNNPPAAKAVATPSLINGISSSASVTLDASTSTDAENDPLTYAWTLKSSPPESQSASTLTNANSSIATFAPDLAGTYIAEVSVNDGHAISTASATITVNTPPVAKAAISTPTPIAIGQTVQLDSTGSSDSDGNTITYTWKLTVPTGSNTTLSDTQNANPTFMPDRGGNYTAELIVNDGLVDSQPVTVTANVSSVSVMITSPPGQATITGDTVTIQGLVVGMSDNVGVTVNGAHHPAVVLDNTFVAVDIPLQPGPNTITVTATDAVTGQTATTSIELTSTGPAPVTVEAEPETGLAPLPVSFHVTWQADWVPTQITADLDGNGTLDYASTDLSVTPQYTYAAAGIYQAAFTFTDAQGATQQLKVPVVIQDEAILDQKFQALWGELIGNLSVANADGAANYFLPGSRAKYHAAFVALGSKLPTIVSSFSSLHKSTITDSYGEYLITRNINGKDYAFFVYFRQGSDGTWGLESM